MDAKPAIIVRYDPINGEAIPDGKLVEKANEFFESTVEINCCMSSEFFLQALRYVGLSKYPDDYYRLDVRVNDKVYYYNKFYTSPPMNFEEVFGQHLDITTAIIKMQLDKRKEENKK